MPSHPDRVRRNYPSETYYPCDRYTEHVIVDGKCFMCSKTLEEINKLIDETIKKQILDIYSE